MRIKQMTRQAGPDGVVQPGTIRDVSDETGRAMIACGAAVLVEEPKPTVEREAEAADDLADQDASPVVAVDQAPKPKRKHR